MHKVEEIIEKKIDEARVGINAGQLRELAHRMEDKDPVYVLTKNGKVLTITSSKKTGTSGPGLYLFVD